MQKSSEMQCSQVHSVRNRLIALIQLSSIIVHSFTLFQRLSFFFLLLLLLFLSLPFPCHQHFLCFGAAGGFVFTPFEHFIYHLATAVVMVMLLILLATVPPIDAALVSPLHSVALVFLILI